MGHHNVSEMEVNVLLAVMLTCAYSMSATLLPWNHQLGKRATTTTFVQSWFRICVCYTIPTNKMTCGPFVSMGSSKGSVKDKCFDAEGAEHGYHREVLELQVKLFTSGEYSDMTITCQAETFRVHKLIVCPRSAFFAAAMKNFKEADTHTVDLPEDEPHVVEMMLHWMYQGHYIFLKYALDQGTYCDNYPESSRTGRCKGFGTGECECGRDSGLRNLTKLYILADKCIIPGLKESVLAKFKEHCEMFWDHFELLQVVSLLWNRTTENDEIREVVLNTIAKHPRVVDKPELKRVFEECDGFALAVCSKLGKVTRALKRKRRY